MNLTERGLPPEEQDWHRFQQFDQMHDHWQRPGWTEGRRSYHWLLPFDAEPALTHLAQQCQCALIDLPMFDLIPPWALHLTLQRADFTVDVSNTQLDAMLTSAQRCCAGLGALRLKIGWLAGSQGAIRFTALPVQAVTDLRHAVIRATAEARGQSEPGAVLDEHFWPHVSIAYCNALTSVAPVVARLAPLRTSAPVQVDVTAVHLVELRREGRSYCWQVVERVSLGQVQTSGRREPHVV